MDYATPFTVRAVLRTDKVNDKALAPISVCVTIAGKRAYFSTALRVTEDQWKEGRVRNHPNANLYNAQIAKIASSAEATLLQNQPKDIDDVRRLLSGAAAGGSFIEYAERVLPTFQIAFNTRRRWRHDLDHIRDYAPELRWRDITPEWLTVFNRHLLALKYEAPDPRAGKNRMTQNSARKTFTFLRRVFNEAKADGTTKSYPFSTWKLPPETRTQSTYLTMEEVESIHTLLHRTDQPPALMNVLAHFLLECYSGIRHSDWSKWQVERLTNADSLKLTTTKTGEPIYLPLANSPRLSEVVTFIRSSGFKYSGCVQDANRFLKTIGSLAGVKKNLTTHVARHSCATLLLEKGFSKETVAEVLGVSRQVVDRYAKMTRQKVRREYEILGGL